MPETIACGSNLQRSVSTVLRTTNNGGPVSGLWRCSIHARERQIEIKYENTVCGRQGRRRSLYRTVIIMFSPDQITTPRERTKPLENRFFLSVSLIMLYYIWFFFRSSAPSMCFSSSPLYVLVQSGVENFVYTEHSKTEISLR